MLYALTGEYIFGEAGTMCGKLRWETHLTVAFSQTHLTVAFSQTHLTIAFSQKHRRLAQTLQFGTPFDSINF